MGADISNVVMDFRPGALIFKYDLRNNGVEFGSPVHWKGIYFSTIKLPFNCRQCYCDGDILCAIINHVPDVLYHITFHFSCIRKVNIHSKIFLDLAAGCLDLTISTCGIGLFDMYN